MSASARVAPAPAHRLEASARWRLPALPIWLAIVVYVVVGVLAYLPAWLHGPGHTLNCGGCGDNGQEVWFLAWASHALTHLQDPLRTTWIHYPWGADLANNTSMPLVGFVGTPITLLFGPVATYNLLLVIAFAASATAAMFACRRWVRSGLAAFLGGLLYGFSPYMVGQGEGHLFVLMAFVPPLLLLVLDDILVRRSWSARRSGLLLGLLIIVQLGTSVEILAEAALVAVIGVVLYAIFRPAEVRNGWPHIWRSLALGIVIAVPFVLAVLVIGQTGPEHAVGPVHPVSLLAGISSDLLSPFVPTTSQHFNLGAAAYGSKLVALTPTGKPPSPDVVENGAYIGIPLVLLLGWGVWRLRREPIVRFSAAMALISLVLSMGSRLHVGGSMTAVRLPFVILTHLPLLKSEAASRYSVLMWVFVSLLAAIVLDRCLFAPLPRVEDQRRRGELVRRSATGILLVLGLLALVPQWPYAPIVSQQVAPWFASSEVRRIPLGSTVLTYPTATNSHNLPMFWQAVNGFRYRIPAGEVAVPQEHYTPLQLALDTCWLEPNLKMPRASLVPPTRVILLSWQVRTVVVPFQYTINPSCAMRFLSKVLGSPPRIEHEAAVWRPTPGRLVHLVSTGGG